MISIAMCTYNGEKFLREQLDSIVNQTIKCDELIISDDNSSDNTLKIVEEYIDQINIKLNINKPNLGVYKNFEKAISLCNGDIIFCCDQDDVWKLDKIEKHLNKFNEQPNSLLVFSNAACVLNTIDNYLYPLWNDLEDTSSFETLVYRGGSVAGCCMSFKKELLEGMYPFPDKIYHDDYLITVAAIKGEINYVDQELIYYRQHGDNVFGITRGGKLSYYKSLFTNVDSYLKHREYIYGRHQLMYNALCEHGFVSQKLRIELDNNLEFCEHRANIRNVSKKESKKIAKEDFKKGYYKKYSKGNKEYYKDLYDISVVGE
jgi:glycosyltransferase involved in cell wall biosynthesis